ncbi:MAG: hypothetical protein LHV69_06480 [Elusimicrobia bacterium]|nr:hypothetical protein [Candidatus Obscuribacterium magneticum]
MGTKGIEATTLFVITLLFFITLKTHRSYIGQGDEPHYIVIAESLTLDRDLELSNNYRSPWLKDFDPNDHHSVKTPDGRERPFHSIGLPILGIPIYAFAHGYLNLTARLFGPTTKDKRWIFTKNMFSFSMMLLGAFFSILLFRFFQDVTGRSKLAWIMALLFSLAPPLLSYSLVFFTELPTAVLITFLMWKLYKKEPFNVIHAALIGYLPWLHTRNYLIAIAFLLIFWIQEGVKGKRINFFKRLGGLCRVPTLIVFVLWGGILLANVHLWGGLSPTAAWKGIPFKPFDPAYLPISLPALFFDRSQGLFVFAPLYLFFICGYALLYKRNPEFARHIVIIIACYTITFAGYKQWWGGWSPPPRLLVPIVPLLALGVLMFVRAAADQKSWRWPVPLMLGGTFFLSLLYWQVPKLLWNQEDGINLFLTHWLGKVGTNVQDLLPNFFWVPYTPQWMALVYAALLLFINTLTFADLIKGRTPVSKKLSQPKKFVA